MLIQNTHIYRDRMLKIFNRHKYLNKMGIPLTMLLLATSCDNGQKKESDTFPAIESTVLTDTVPDIESKKDSVPKMKPLPSQASIQEALDYMLDSPDSEKYAEGIFPRMARENLPYLKKLLKNEYSRFIVVDKGKMRVFLYDKYGRKERSYRMACAKNYGTKHKKADSRTPEGFFSAEGIYDSTDWLFTDDNGKTSKKKGQFGPRFIRIKIPTTSQIGIHGTCAPWSIGSRSSHGCIRLTNEHIMELVELVEPGMPVIIIPGSRDMRVNADEGYDIPTITTDGKPTKIAPEEKKPETDSIPPVATEDSITTSGKQIVVTKDSI